MGLIPGGGTKIPHAAWRGKKKKKKKKGRRYLTDISPRKIDKWSLSTRREA